MILYTKLRETLTKKSKVKYNPERRRFGKIAVAGIIGANVLSSSIRCSTDTRSSTDTGSIAGNRENTSNVKLSAMSERSWARVEERPLYEQSEDYLMWAKQIGLHYVILESDSGVTNTIDYESLLKIRLQIEAAGLKVANVELNAGSGTSILLNLPDRDEKVEETKSFIRNVGKAGYNTIWTHYLGIGIWRTEREDFRFASGSAFDYEKVKRDGYKRRNGETWFPDRPALGRVYTEQEVWDNWTHFIKAIVPVLEETGVRFAIHPDDPTGYRELGGIPRIFSTFDAYVKAFEIADSPNVGIYLGVGSYIEGGKETGKDILDVIRYFGEQNKIFKVDFRNVSGPIPHFIETFPDNGYVDMYKVMRALVEVNNHCVVCDDHAPQVIGGRIVADSYSYGYMRALLERALDEVKEGDRLQWPDTYAL